MRRVARHVFTFLAVVSGLLCIAVCVLWVRSYVVADRVKLQVTQPNHFRDDAFESIRGRLWFRGARLSIGPDEALWKLDDEVDGLHWLTSPPPRYVPPLEPRGP